MILSAGVVSAEDNNTFASSDIDDIPVQGNFTELQNIIDDAENGSTVSLDKNYSFADGDYPDGVIISKSLTINGNGAVLDGKNSSRIFNIIGAYDESDENKETAGHVILKNISFINGNAGEGAAVSVNKFNRFSDNTVFLDIYDCIFVNNTAVNGGAVYVCDIYDGYYLSDTAVLNIYNSTFVQNYAEVLAGAVYAISLNITDSSFINNSADNGGAVYASAVKIFNSHFISNSAVSSGGVMEVVDSIDIVGSEFRNNSAEDGGVFNILDLKHVNIDKSRFINNFAETEGGVLFYAVSPVTTKTRISNSLFQSNNAGSGGIIACRGDYYDKINLIKNTFKDNANEEILVKFKSFHTYYGSDKQFKVKLISTITKKPIKNAKVSLTFTKDYMYPASLTLHATTNSRGIALFKSISKHPTNSYIGYFLHAKGYGQALYDSQDIMVDKCPTIVKAPEITSKFKKSKNFKITVKNKFTNKFLKKVKVKVKVYTGKKHKIYIVKTDKKGVAKLNVKKLSKGTHKVVISSGNSKYKISAKSTIRIK